MHQTADTSFLARLGLVLALAALSFEAALTGDVLAVLVCTAFSFADLVCGMDLDEVADVAFGLSVTSAWLASRASLRSRLLRWSLFSLGFMF